MINLFQGVATALATPMLNNGDIDFEAYENLVRFQLESGISALIVAGTTGEGATLTIGEKIELLKRTQALRGEKYNCPIMLGTGSNNTKLAIEHTKIAKENGADFALIVTPYYNKTSQSGLIAHYNAIADAVDIPIILYNVPGRTGLNLQAETVVDLAKHKNIVALKDATGDMKNLTKIKNLLGEDSDFALYSGDDGTFFDFLMHGGDGIISVVSNCLPKTFINIFDLYQEGKIKESRGLQNKLDSFIGMLFSDISPTPLKAVLKVMGYGAENFRLPLVPTNEMVRKNIVAEYCACMDLEKTSLK
ncbi:MAG: 4-hydroxy-tetrahydrodipicolinate synthase [Fusobacterium sp.]|nr:4-hydroxy-tetrahydrodipicolinate synthase [Fusobacterium sp.]